MPASPPGEQAGTVTITVSAAGHHSEVEVEVTYQLTALTGPAGSRLQAPGSRLQAPRIRRPIPRLPPVLANAITARLRTAGTRLPSNHGN